MVHKHIPTTNTDIMWNIQECKKYKIQSRHTQRCASKQTNIDTHKHTRNRLKPPTLSYCKIVHTYSTYIHAWLDQSQWLLCSREQRFIGQFCTWWRLTLLLLVWLPVVRIRRVQFAAVAALSLQSELKAQPLRQPPKMRNICLYGARRITRCHR